MIDTKWSLNNARIENGKKGWQCLKNYLQLGCHFFQLIIFYNVIWFKGAPCPMARVSQMFNVLNKITINALIAPKNIGERELAIKHFNHIQPKDIIFLDRGYPAYWLFLLIISAKAHFCASSI